MNRFRCRNEKNVINLQNESYIRTPQYSIYDFATIMFLGSMQCGEQTYSAVTVIQLSHHHHYISQCLINS